VIYFDNAYRMLGLFDNATRSQARAVFHQLKIRTKIAGEASESDPLSKLASAERTEEALRDAFNALGNVDERLRQRLFWFSNNTSRDRYALDCMTSGDFHGAAEAWATASDPASRANLARLYHALMIARDLFPRDAEMPAIPEKYTWLDAARTWREVIESEPFWSGFEGAERASGFEPPAFGADITSLRTHVWEHLLEPSIRVLGKLIAGAEYGKARDHIEDLRDAGLPARTVTGLEKETFAIVFSGVDLTIDEITAQMEGSGSGIAPVRKAYERYRAEVVPVINNMLKLAGFNFEPTKQLCDASAEFLRVLVQRAASTGANQYALALQSESNAIAKGIVEAQKQATGGSTTVGNNYRPTGTPRSKKKNVPPWLMLKGILLLVAAIARTASCANDHSYSYSTTPLVTEGYDSYSGNRGYDPPSYDTLADMTSPDSDAADAPELRDLSDDIDSRASSLHVLMRRMDDANDNVWHLDSEAASPSINDTLRAVARRAVQPWFKIYKERWSEFDTTYKGYVADITHYNAALRKLPKPKGDARRPERKSIDGDIWIGNTSYKRTLEKWKKVYEKGRQEGLRTMRDER
jgi:hypothetical protein